MPLLSKNSSGESKELEGLWFLEGQEVALIFLPLSLSVVVLNLRLTREGRLAFKKKKNK